MDWKARFEGGIRLEDKSGSWQEEKRPGGTNQAYWGLTYESWSRKISAFVTTSPVLQPNLVVGLARRDLHETLACLFPGVENLVHLCSDKLYHG